MGILRSGEQKAFLKVGALKSRLDYGKLMLLCVPAINIIGSSNFVNSFYFA